MKQSPVLGCGSFRMSENLISRVCEIRVPGDRIIPRPIISKTCDVVTVVTRRHRSGPVKIAPSLEKPIRCQPVIYSSRVCELDFITR
jgi:hypothetical protein